MSWIKVDSTTPHKPEVLKLARVLEVSRDDAFGKAMRFWIWLDGVTVDGRVDGVTSHDVDAVVGAEGVAVALEAVGWLELDDESQTITVPNFEAHNGETAKARGLKTQRQARWRKKTVDVPASTSVSTREEKSREEKSKENTPLAPQGEKPINPIDSDSKPSDNGRKPRKLKKPELLPPLPASLGSGEMLTAWDDWIRHRREIRKPLTVTCAAKQVAQFEKWGETRAIAAIEHTILKGWQGLREPDAPPDKPNRLIPLTELEARGKP